MISILCNSFASLLCMAFRHLCYFEENCTIHDENVSVRFLFQSGFDRGKRLDPYENIEWNADWIECIEDVPFQMHKANSILPEFAACTINDTSLPCHPHSNLNFGSDSIGSVRKNLKKQSSGNIITLFDWLFQQYKSKHFVPLMCAHTYYSLGLVCCAVR